MYSPGILQHNVIVSSTMQKISCLLYYATELLKFIPIPIYTVLYGSTKENLLHRLQKKAMRLISSSKYIAHTEPICKQDAREAMRVFFFCTYKMYLYAQNEISYEYIQILF